MLIIDAATSDDALRLLEIEQESILPPWTHESLLSEICNKDTFFAVARCLNDGDQKSKDSAAQYDIRAAKTAAHFRIGIIGFVVLRKMGDDGELLQIAVDKDARRAGLADMLMGKALQYARNHRLQSIFIEVRRSNMAAIALYEKHGASALRIRKDYYTDPVEDAIMMRITTKEYS
ncbi:MAG: ribosomal protein S18-alanine N-acetyltransferase [Oscillospiraceae bacterium]|nr:ribosomal protein S18-alanine N-acetyltransferase [Oscillospiraceae bacterium]